MKCEFYYHLIDQLFNHSCTVVILWLFSKHMLNCIILQYKKNYTDVLYLLKLTIIDITDALTQIRFFVNFYC